MPRQIMSGPRPANERADERSKVRHSDHDLATGLEDAPALRQDCHWVVGVLQHMIHGYAVEVCVGEVCIVEHPTVDLQADGSCPVDRGLVWLDPFGLHTDQRHSRNHVAQPAAYVKIPASRYDQRVV